LKDGTCETCPGYTRADEKKLRCQADECDGRQKLKISGLCEDCRKGFRATADGRDCVKARGRDDFQEYDNQCANKDETITPENDRET